MEPQKRPLFTAEKAALILDIPYSALVRYVWVYKFIKPAASLPWRFDQNQLVEIRRIRDMLKCGIPHKDIVGYLTLPQVSIEIGSCQVVNTVKFAEEQVQKGLKRYRGLMG